MDGRSRRPEILLRGDGSRRDRKIFFPLLPPPFLALCSFCSFLCLSTVNNMPRCAAPESEDDEEGEEPPRAKTLSKRKKRPPPPAEQDGKF